MGIGNDIRPRKMPKQDSSFSRRKAHSSRFVFDPSHVKATPAKETITTNSEDVTPKDKVLEAISSEPAVEKSAADKSNNFFDWPQDKSAKVVKPKKEPRVHENAFWTRSAKVTKNIFRWWVILIIVLAFAGWLTYQNFSLIRHIFTKNTSAVTTDAAATTAASSEQTPTVEAVTPILEDTTPAVTATPAATVAPTINKSDITISVLNGNGVASSATQIKGILVKAGFTVSKTSNARSFSYAQTNIYYKTGQESEARLVGEALVGRTLIYTKSDPVAGIYDVVVVVGKK